MWPSLKNPRIFPTGQVTHYNVTILKNPRIFFHWAGNPLQCDHFWKIIVFFPTGQVTHYNVTTFEKSSYFSPGLVTHYNVTTFEKFSYFFIHWAGNPLQCDHPEKSSYFSTGQVTHYNVTTFEKSSYFSSWAGNPLQCDHFWKILVFFHWAGNPLQCDHFWEILVFFQTSGRSPGTIRPLVKFFAFFYHRAGCPKQFDPFKKKQQKKKRWVVFQMTCFLISTSLCKGCVSIYCFQD